MWKRIRMCYVSFFSFLFWFFSCFVLYAANNLVPLLLFFMIVFYGSPFEMSLPCSVSCWQTTICWWKQSTKVMFYWHLKSGIKNEYFSCNWAGRRVNVGWDGHSDSDCDIRLWIVTEMRDDDDDDEDRWCVSGVDDDIDVRLCCCDDL